MRKSLLRAFAAVLVLALVGAGSALALRLEIGNIVVVTDGGFTPTTLPKKGFAPIKLHGYGKISTKDGGIPPVLETITSSSIEEIVSVSSTQPTNRSGCPSEPGSSANPLASPRTTAKSR